MKREPRLQFTDEERAAPELKKAIKNMPSTILHHEVQQYEDDNVGVESAHKLEKASEDSRWLIQSAHRSHQLKLYREATCSEYPLEKAEFNALQKKAQTETPQSNPYSKRQQKQEIKKQYVAAKSGKNIDHTRKTADSVQKVTEKTKEAGAFIWRHRKGFGIVAALFFAVLLLLNCFSSCSVLVDGIASGLAASTYAAQDSDMTSAETTYSAMEDELQAYLDCYESTHSYEEYVFDLDPIEHDPYVLISIISALHPGEWTLDEVQETLQMLFENQYLLTETVSCEIRYISEIRTEYQVTVDPITGETIMIPYQYEVEVPYSYEICTVTLENFDLSHVPAYIMTEEQLERYATYMATLGNRPDLFSDSAYIGRYDDYEDYDIPPEALEDEVFAAMIKEAEKYLGYPYVWGGSSPSTSFDCSGFVSWVINHSSWDVGRLGAQGLCNICTPVSASNARPGDLVFFVGTYDTPGVSHVGIYVGNGMMIHCGDPISYANIGTSYWQEHFYCYGRLPAA